MSNDSKNKKDEDFITFIDDTIDVGKEPLPIDNPEAQRIHDEFMEKYDQRNKKKIKNKATCTGA